MSNYTDADSRYSGGESRVGGARVGVQGERTTIWLYGEHDRSTAGVVTNVLDGAVAVNENDVVVDLAGVTFMDGSTIRALVQGHERCRERGRLLTLRSPRSGQRRLLDICDMAEWVETDTSTKQDPGKTDSQERGFLVLSEVESAGKHKRLTAEVDSVIRQPNTHRE